MVKAVIFDCFGVLVTEAWLPFKAKYFGEGTGLFEQASDIAKQANKGLISHEDFISQIAELADLSPAEVNAFISRNVPDESLFEYIAELKKDYKIGFLSNIAGDYLKRMFNEQQLAQFDVIELSYESGFIKPQAEAYQMIASRMNVGAHEAVLVDDQERNVTGAQEAGMQAILYKDVGQLKKDLRPLLASS